MDAKQLIREFTSFSLTIINPALYELRGNKSELYFHDSERSDLFFIYLNEFINTEFDSPIGEKRVSLLGLMEEFCQKFRHNDDFKKFLIAIEETKAFFYKKRYYKYYMSPHDINFEISFSELISIQSNYSKHSCFHLTRVKKKLKNHFKINNIPDLENEDYNFHLETFKEAVLDDRLNFNQTHIVEKLGKFFMAYWDLLNSKYQHRIKSCINEHIKKNGRLAIWDCKKPNNLDEIEEFFWSIRGENYYPKSRILEFTPNTLNILIEEETTKEKMLIKNK